LQDTENSVCENLLKQKSENLKGFSFSSSICRQELNGIPLLSIREIVSDISIMGVWQCRDAGRFAYANFRKQSCIFVQIAIVAQSRCIATLLFLWLDYFFNRNIKLCGGFSYLDESNVDKGW